MTPDTATPREPEDEAGLDPDFEALLEYVKRSRGFDFTGYKRASLRRRVDKEMAAVGVPTYADYVDHLEVYPDGFARLFNTVLINVTSFFRDAPVWEHLSSDVLPRILAAKPHGEPIRVWSAGCASGQEPYSLAIALAELLGMAAFRERVKIYATDVDEEALAHARGAAYTPRESESLPPDLREKYTEPEMGRAVIRKDLRRALIFGRHDLLQDAPISRIDLLLCRNTVMYFNSEVQSRILDRFHFALNDGGFLVLGKAEMPFAHGGLFGAGDLKKRVFVKIPREGLRDRVPLMPPSSPGGAAPDPALRLRETAFNAAPVAQIVVDADGRLALANESARALFGLGPRDLGRPIQDLEVSYRPVELRSCIERASSERQPVSVKEAPWIGPRRRGGPGRARGARSWTTAFSRGVSVSFTDVTRARQMSDELLEAGRELETAYEELQSTNEELETTNEELQSTNEELETTNEELQSTNEELETTNEELQSTNEELDGGQRRDARAVGGVRIKSTPSWSLSCPASAAASWCWTPICACRDGMAAPRTCGD